MNSQHAAKDEGSRAAMQQLEQLQHTADILEAAMHLSATHSRCCQTMHMHTS
jgi:hypothetical protein